MPLNDVTIRKHETCHEKHLWINRMLFMSRFLQRRRACHST